MLAMDVRTLVSAIVLQELNGKGRKDEALHFHFDVGISHYTNNKNFNQRCGLHLLYQVNPGYRYINVFSAITESPFSKVKEIKEWNHEATHDSCWKTIGVFSDIYFNMARKINASRVLAGLPEVAPVNMTQHTSAAVFEKLYDWVAVKVYKDETDESSYRKMIEIL